MNGIVEYYFYTELSKIKKKYAEMFLISLIDYKVPAIPKSYSLTNLNNLHKQTKILRKSISYDSLTSE